MQRLEISGAVRPIYGSLGVKRLIEIFSHGNRRAQDFLCTFSEHDKNFMSLKKATKDQIH